jgi:hypothetical protein
MGWAAAPPNHFLNNIFCSLQLLNINEENSSWIRKTLTSYSLFEFTKDIHSRLPRELRDIIYRYLLTEQDVEIICRGSSIPLNNFPCKCDK